MKKPFLYPAISRRKFYWRFVYSGYISLFIPCVYCMQKSLSFPKWSWTPQQKRYSTCTSVLNVWRLTVTLARVYCTIYTTWKLFFSSDIYSYLRVCFPKTILLPSFEASDLNKFHVDYYLYGTCSTSAATTKTYSSYIAFNVRPWLMRDE